MSVPRIGLLVLLACGAPLAAAAGMRDPPELALCDEARDVYYEQHDAAAALALQKECLAKEKVHDGWVADEYRSLGYYEHALGHYAEAIAAFDRAIALYPAPNALLLAHRGMARIEYGQIAEARRDFDAALREDPASTTALFGLALVFEREGDVAAARAQLLRAFAAGERSPELVRRLRTYEITGAELPKRLDPPRYPTHARIECRQGRVDVRITIDDLGLPLAVAIEKSSGHRDLDRAALDGARRWNFDPGRVDGKPVGGDVVVPVTFSEPCGDIAR